MIRPLVSLLPDLARNVWAGCRLSTFVPVRIWHFRLSLVQVFMLLILSFALNFIYDFVSSRPDNQFNIYGLNYQATLYLLFFFSVVIIAGLQHAYISLLKLVVLILSTTPITFIVYASLLWLVDKQQLIDYRLGSWCLFVLYLSWHLLIIMRVIRKVFKPRVWRGAALMSIYIIFNVIPYHYLPNQPLWYTKYARAEIRQQTASLDLEKIFYAQQGLIEENSSRLLDQRSGIIDLYFLGFAAYADEDVFMNEAELARRLFDERFDTKGRSMLLANNQASFAELPLANQHNLEVALKLISAHMDPEEDVLFLFLTSHGEQENGLSVSLGGAYALNPLTPQALSQALSSSTIKWQVIVISACFSGAFIDALAGPHTLVMTAASKDRASFGCGHNGDFTYFGDAYFGRHLKQEYSFITAFNKALIEIERRERNEDRTPSLPQIAVGEDIRAVLKKLIDQLKTRADSPAQTVSDHAYALAQPFHMPEK